MKTCDFVQLLASKINFREFPFKQKEFSFLHLSKYCVIDFFRSLLAPFDLIFMYNFHTSAILETPFWILFSFFTFFVRISTRELATIKWSYFCNLQWLINLKCASNGYKLPDNSFSFHIPSQRCFIIIIVVVVSQTIHFRLKPHVQ